MRIYGSREDAFAAADAMPEYPGQIGYIHSTVHDSITFVLTREARPDYRSLALATTLPVNEVRVQMHVQSLHTTNVLEGEEE